jgi:pteridine reductase
MKVALVTGSGKRRLGSFVAAALAERGYALVIHYRSSAAEAQRSVADFNGRGVPAIALGADLADESAVRAMFDATLARFGRLDALVNCAAIWQPRRLEETTAADLRAHFEANTLGTFLCCQQGGLIMVRQPEGGAIVNFGDWAERRPYLDYAAYFPSKGAIPAMTRSMAVELGTRNPRVRVNCVLPGPVLFQPDLPEAEREEAIRATLVHHAGEPENIVQAVLYCIDNTFVTGDCLTVDGGRTIFAQGK